MCKEEIVYFLKKIRNTPTELLKSWQLAKRLEEVQDTGWS